MSTRICSGCRASPRGTQPSTRSSQDAASKKRPRCWGRTLTVWWSATAGRRIAASDRRSIKRTSRIYSDDVERWFATRTNAGLPPGCRPSCNREGGARTPEQCTESKSAATLHLLLRIFQW